MQMLFGGCKLQPFDKVIRLRSTGCVRFDDLEAPALEDLLRAILERNHHGCAPPGVRADADGAGNRSNWSLRTGHLQTAVPMRLSSPCNGRPARRRPR